MRSNCLYINLNLTNKLCVIRLFSRPVMPLFIATGLGGDGSVIKWSGGTGFY